MEDSSEQEGDLPRPARAAGRLGGIQTSDTERRRNSSRRLAGPLEMSERLDTISLLSSFIYCMYTMFFSIFNFFFFFRPSSSTTRGHSYDDVLFCSPRCVYTGRVQFVRAQVRHLARTARVREVDPEFFVTADSLIDAASLKTIFSKGFKVKCGMLIKRKPFSSFIVIFFFFEI